MTSDATLDEKKIITEWVNWLRNQDILTTTQRGVTTDTDTGVYEEQNFYIITAQTGIKNIRSIVVNSVTLTYGEDYYVDLDHDDSGTKRCKIYYTSNQNGAYTITFDYGTDKIHPDYPQGTLKISNYPRIGTDILDIETVPGGMGEVNRNTLSVQTIVYAAKKSDVKDYISAIRSAVRTSAKDFYFLGHYVQVTSQGPMLPLERDRGKDKIFHKNIDVKGLFRYEK